MKKYIFLILISLFSMSAFSQEQTTDAKDEVYDKVWVLTRLNNKKVTYDNNSEKITLIITRENEYASGSAGCNTYVSQVVIKRSHIMFRSIGSTRMACPDANMQKEKTYLNNLNEIDSYKIIDEDLYLYRNNRPILVYTKE